MRLLNTYLTVKRILKAINQHCTITSMLICLFLPSSQSLKPVSYTHLTFIMLTNWVFITKTSIFTSLHLYIYNFGIILPRKGTSTCLLYTSCKFPHIHGIIKEIIVCIRTMNKPFRCILSFLRKIGILKPVSYTHLDVYKRQIILNAATHFFGYRFKVLLRKTSVFTQAFDFLKEFLIHFAFVI